MLILTKSDEKALHNAYKLSPKEVIEKVKLSKLQGRGGANFPTGLKWELTAKEKKDKYLICNADEGEPGTFKDKLILTKNPKLLIEGILIASYAISAKKAYIYLRREYSYLKKNLEEAINSYPKAKEQITIIDGAGSYLCGDETSIMNSIEGKFAFPRSKPPYPAQSGLFTNPTCINNVETLTNVALIFLDDNWTNDNRLFSISGDVKNPGVFEEKENITFKELLDKTNPEEPIKAIFFGAAGGCVPYNDNFIFSIEEIQKLNASLGSCTLIIVGKSRSIIDVCINFQEFFIHENCGKCVPCREGNYQLLKLLIKVKNKEATKEDLSLIEKLAHMIKETSFCPLGQSSTLHLITSITHFKEEFIKQCK